MARMHQEVYIKSNFGTPRLKGRLKPILMMPIRKVIKPFIKDNLPLYIDPLPIKPFLPEPVEPKLKPIIEDIIPEYIGDPNEQQEIIHKTPADEPASNKGREITPTVEDTPRAL